MDTGERLARIETKVEHISRSQDKLAQEQASAVSVAEMTFGDLKESIFSLRVNSETLLRTLEATHRRMDKNETDLEKLNKKVEDIENEVRTFKTRITVLMTVGAAAVTVFWAVFGNSIQNLASKVLGG